MGQVITIASQKGGVGKTTTAVNLAYTLCLSGKKVLLADLDPQGNASSGVGFRRGEQSSHGQKKQNVFLSTVLQGGSIEALICPTQFSPMMLIPSSSELSELEVIQEIQSKAIPKFKKQIEAIAKGFDFLLIDCPPSLGGLPTIALSVSDSVLVPIQCEYYAMEGLSQILPVIKNLQQTTNSKLKIFGLLLTMYSSELQLSNDVVAEVEEYFKEAVFRTIIPRDVVLAEAASHGLPAFEYDSLSRGSWSYIELAREVLNERS